MELQEHIELAPYTTFHIGGPARYFVRAHSVQDIEEAIAFAKEKSLPFFVLGGGSNVLMSDEGFDGIVIKLELEGISVSHEGERVRIVAGAGESWDGLVLCAIEEHAWGLENLSGIPGTVGGAVVQSIGAYGAAVEQTLHSALVLDTVEGTTKVMSNADCAFDYRDSFFKHDSGRHIVLEATFLLGTTPAPNTSYKDLAARFGTATPTAQDIRSAVLEIRKGKFPDIGVEGTAGSFFKNPIMTAVEAQRLKEQYPGMPLFVMPETDGIKVPLAWLLDNALHLKGTRAGGARLFENQVLVIAAEKGTPARDVQALASLVQKKVFDELKIKIEPEVKVF